MPFPGGRNLSDLNPEEVYVRLEPLRLSLRCLNAVALRHQPQLVAVLDERLRHREEICLEAPCGSWRWCCWATLIRNRPGTAARRWGRPSPTISRKNGSRVKAEGPSLGVDVMRNADIRDNEARRTGL